MDAHERSPLLPQDEESTQPTEAGRQSAEEAAGSSDVPSDGSVKFPIRDLAHCGLVMFILALIVASGCLIAIPLNQILEANICRQIRPDLELQSSACGDDPDVQGELAMLSGWSVTFALLAGIITAIPFGILADKYGRKSGLCLCLLGICMSETFTIMVCFWPNVFPYRLIWLSSVFLCIGGGVTILSSLIYSTLADLAPDSYRASAFFALGAANFITEILFSPLASMLMQRNIWLPVVVGMCLFVPTMAIALAMPETLRRDLKSSDSPEDETNNVDGDEERNHVNEDNDFGKKSWRAKLAGLIPKKHVAALLFIWGDQQLTLLMLTLLTTTLGKFAQDVLLQFTHKRFGWAWSKAAYLVSFRAALTLFVLMIFLPAANYVLTTTMSLGPKRKDINLTRLTCAMLLVGHVIIGLSPTAALMLFGVAVASFGLPYNLVLRSLLAQLVEPHHRAILFTSIALLENVGALIAGPLLAASFRLGMKLGGAWIGLPFLSAGILFTITMVVLCFVRVS